MKDLIIVESPAKIKTIKKFLGPKYLVEASVGHVRDLPSKDIGVDEQHDFAPQYQVIPGKDQVVARLRKAAKAADTVYLAPDPDREGEAIAWHVAELIKKYNTNVKRIQFNEITARAVKEALANPSELNESLFNSQQARRILDRLVGYRISPLLWKKVKRGISAGRVQSVALHLIVARERERQAFIPEEYWPFKVKLGCENGQHFTADLWKVDGRQAHIPDEKTALTLEKSLHEQNFYVHRVEEKQRARYAKPPFTTSTLQQEASNRLGFTAKRTMSVAQRLYEGVELGTQGTTALITYMRTDSVRIAEEARQQAKIWIENELGKDFYPARPNMYKSRGGAQEAHEAIRPVDPALTPAQVASFLPGEQFKLYSLIWKRFMASQMAPAKFWDTIILSQNGQSLWRSRGERMIFAGFLQVWEEKKTEAADQQLPQVTQNDPLKLLKVHKEQKFTQPPARYTEASLVRSLEEKGIGRPSTYAAIISTLKDRDYVAIQEKQFVPTDLGGVVNDLLSNHFTTLMDVDFTARMEADLDKVAEGEKDWKDLMRAFAADFYPTLEKATQNMASVKAGQESGLNCPECDQPLLIRFGRNGSFLACSSYPDCKFSSDYQRDERGNVEIVKNDLPQESVGNCPQCGKPLHLKKTRAGGRFIGCSGYPDCRHAAPFGIDIACPVEGCDGEIVEKSTRSGKIFYGCNKYPKCDFAVWDWPVPEPCPLCESKVLVCKETKARGKHIACPVKGCAYWRKLEE